MLCLRRRREEKVVIQTSDGPITIMVVEGSAILGFDAPPCVKIVRQELLDLVNTARRVVV